MGWETELNEFIREKGFNQDTRLIEGRISNTSPLTFQPFAHPVEMNARFAQSVADDAAVGQTVLAIQNMETRRCYVIARLV